MNDLNRRNMLIGAGLAGGGVVGAGLAAPAIAQQRRVLRMQSIDPPAFVGPSIVLPRFKELLEGLTGGELSVEVYTGGQVVPTAEIPAALAAGVIDLSYTSNVYYTGALAENVLSYSALPPMMIPDVNFAKEIYLHRGVDNIIAEAYRPQGVEFLGSIFLGDPITFWSKSRIEGVNDLSGFQVRSFGFAARTMEKLGASPVFMPHEEVYSALSQGTIDGSMTNASYYKRASYFEVAPFIYEPGWYNVTHMCAMASSAMWDGLTDEQRAILNVAVRRLSEEMQHFTWLEYMQMRTELESMGSTLVSWSEEDAAAIREAGQSFLPDIRSLNENVDKGISVIEDVVSSLQMDA